MRIVVYYVPGLCWNADTKSYYHPTEEDSRDIALANILRNIGGNRGKGYNGVFLTESAAHAHASRSKRGAYYRFEFDLTSSIEIGVND